MPHVLAVDDDPAIRELLHDYLTGQGWRVTTVASGREMTALLAEEAVDLVLLDLRLPGEDGLQLARELRERATLPIVLLTGRDEEADRVMGLELGADDYVTKPFSARASCSPGSGPCCAATRCRRRCPSAIQHAARVPLLPAGS